MIHNPTLSPTRSYWKLKRVIRHKRPPIRTTLWPIHASYNDCTETAHQIYLTPFEQLLYREIMIHVTNWKHIIRKPVLISGHKKNRYARSTLPKKSEIMKHIRRLAESHRSKINKSETWNDENDDNDAMSNVRRWWVRVPRCGTSIERDNDVMARLERGVRRIALVPLHARRPCWPQKWPHKVVINVIEFEGGD